MTHAFNYRSHKMNEINAAASKVQMELPMIGQERVNRAFAVMDVTPKSRDYSPKHELSTRLNVPILPAQAELVQHECTATIQMLIDSNADKAIRINHLCEKGDEVITHLLDMYNESERARLAQNDAAERCITYHKGRIGELNMAIRNGDRKVQDLTSRRREQEIDLTEICRSEERLKTECEVAKGVIEDLEVENRKLKNSNRTLLSWTSKYRSELVEMRAVEYDLFLQLQEERREVQDIMQFKSAASNLGKVEDDFNRMLESERIAKD